MGRARAPGRAAARARSRASTARRRVPVPLQLRDAPALGPPHIGAWMRTAEPRPADPILLAALTDAWIPAAFAHMEQPNFVPTIDLTIHWRAAPGVPAGEHPWVLGLFTTRLGAGGTWEEDGELWSEDGVLLAQSRQLAIVRDAAVIGHLGLGSNVGDRRANLQAAVDALPAHGVRVLASSSTYDTEPVGEVLDQPEFLNAVIRIETELEPGGAARRVQGGRAGAGARGGRRAARAAADRRRRAAARRRGVLVGAADAAARAGDVAAVRARAAARARSGRHAAVRRAGGRRAGAARRRRRGAPLRPAAAVSNHSAGSAPAGTCPG